MAAPRVETTWRRDKRRPARGRRGKAQASSEEASSEVETQAGKVSIAEQRAEQVVVTVLVIAKSQMGARVPGTAVPFPAAAIGVQLEPVAPEGLPVWDLGAAVFVVAVEDGDSLRRTQTMKIRRGI